MEELLRCLEGFAQQSFKDFRILLCIDGSVDGTKEYIQAHQFSFPILVLEHKDGLNHGRNAARNLALQHITAEWLVFCDSDLIPLPDMLEQHRNMLISQECISAGDISYSNAQVNLWAAYLHTRGKKKYRHGQKIPFYYLTTGNVAMPSYCFTEIGGQDEHMNTYGGGDTEFACRIEKHFELPVVFNAKAGTCSDLNKSTAQALEQMEFFGGNNLRYLYKKHPEYKHIFRLNLITGKDLKSKIFRMALLPVLGRISEFLLGFLPRKIALFFLHHAVGARILKGWHSAYKA